MLKSIPPWVLALVAAVILLKFWPQIRAMLPF